MTYPSGSERQIELHQSQRADQLEMSDFSPAATLMGSRSPPSPPSPSYKTTYYSSARPNSGTVSNIDEGDMGTAADSHCHGLGITHDEDGRHQWVNHLAPSGLAQKSAGPHDETSRTHTFTSFTQLLHKTSSFEYKRCDKGLKASELPSQSSKDNTDFDLQKHRRSDHSNPTSKTKWLHLALIGLSMFSTVFSGIYLGIALTHTTFRNETLISTAPELVTLFARVIELSFVAVFVAFVGQVISRKALMARNVKGITLAEISMRAWVRQPGLVFTQFSSLKSAMATKLGALTILAMLSNILYTTASNTLVSPRLQLGNPEPKELSGCVQTVFSNKTYIEAGCGTPVTNDPDDGGTDCLDIQLAGDSYHNYVTYLNMWTEFAKDPNVASSEISSRPRGFAQMGNTTIYASWVNVGDVGAAAQKWDRIINNVSLVLPNAAVVGATQDPINQIPWPQVPDDSAPSGLDAPVSREAFSLSASVSSPVINALCVNISKTDLAPMVYETWPNAQKPLNPGQWPNTLPPAQSIPLAGPDEWLNATVVDEVFGFGPATEKGRRMPVFPKYPLPYNSVANHTGEHIDAVYLLAAAPPAYPDIYSMCQLSVWRTSSCFTLMEVANKGSEIWSQCEDEQDHGQYFQGPSAVPDSTGSGDSGSWAPSLGFELLSSTSLEDGITDGNSSNARLLTELMLMTREGLNPKLPSLAEALAVLGGSTVVTGSLDGPFAKDYNQSRGPYREQFNATLQRYQYQSGGAYRYQDVFFVVLFLVFMGNILLVVWFLAHSPLITDFTDPLNLFSLAISSPPSDAFADSCGSGPTAEEFKTRWAIQQDGKRKFLKEV